MNLAGNLHLTYCSNIHPGESWREVFDALKNNIPEIKKSIAPEKHFGIGLRLGNEAANELLNKNNLSDFKNWMNENSCYIFTMNGFPYGGFHNTTVKDNVYKPDWTTATRVEYTLNLIKILTGLIPGNSEAGISTSPLSYKPWLNDADTEIEVFEASCINLLKCVTELHLLRINSGKYIHLDIEPEPSCLLENSKETIDFFQNYLLPYGIDYLKKTFHYDEDFCEAIIKDHITVCYDVCHFAVEYEEPSVVIKSFTDAGIKIGKVQLSAALKVRPGATEKNATSSREAIFDQCKLFAESTYLHQTIVKDRNEQLHHFNDLPEALKHFYNMDYTEWRTHYHVPVFMSSYNELQSTQQDILKVLTMLKQNQFTRHLEVETYTWEVLPKQERLELRDSIVREMQWVIKNFE